MSKTIEQLTEEIEAHPCNKCGRIVCDCEYLEWARHKLKSNIKFIEAKDNLWNEIIKTFRLVEIVEWIEKKLGGRK